MKEIMDILSENGYESFVVGGYVRDYLLGFTSYDIDISTSAPIDEIMRLFKGRGVSYKDYYAYHIEDGEYSYDITTYRKENKYKKNKPIDLEVASTLGEDLLRRDFTINTFAIDKDGNFLDLLGAKKDFDARLIRVVGDTEKKLTEDKTRILRAIRFFCTMEFDLDTKILDFLDKYPHYLNEIPREYIRKELDKIFESRDYDKFFYIINNYRISKYLNITVPNQIITSYDKYGVWAQIETTLPFTKEEKKKILSIKKIINRGSILFSDLNEYSDDVISNAAYVLGLQNSLKEMKELKNLHSSIIDIEAGIDIFLKYVKVDDIKRVYKLVEKNIIEGTLNNNKEDIEKFIKDL